MTVRELAEAAGLDVDEVLLGLWDAGLEAYNEPNDRIASNDYKPARRAIGLPTASELRKLEYWERALRLEADDVTKILDDAGIRISPNARLLPKGAVARLKHVARERTLHATPPAPPGRDTGNEAPELVPALAWRTVGRERELRLLAESEVEQIHLALVEDFARDSDPIDPPGVRDKNLLASAVFRQHTSLGSESKYKSVEMAAAALLHSIVHDHPFHNGNKRTGLVSMIVLLAENGLALTCDEKTLFKFIIRVAQHQVVPRDWPQLADREVMWIAEWIYDNSRGVEKGERPIQWRKLKQVLASFGCRCEVSVGSKMNIFRQVPGKRVLGLRTVRPLRTQVKYADDGRDAMKHTIHQIRKDLELDDEHGVDSANFYGDAPALDDFIVKYRGTLKRLARL
jgi:death-on-curing family protein